MGPSPVGDGEHDWSDDHDLVGGWLQWGRGLLATERGDLTCRGAKSWMLQWGRRLLATESRSRYAFPVSDEWLQWGRRLLATESLVNCRRAYYAI